jgi:two-component system response regulator AtoC
MKRTRSNVLVVDDQEVVRKSYLRSLAETQCEVAAVDSGDEALRAMEAHPFDVVMLDLRMPGMDGMSVLRTIKKKWPESEVVIITGYPSVDSAKEAIRLGACDYLAKPVSPDEVIRAADGALMRRHWTLHHESAARGARAGSAAGTP